jgi:hypothetical protein
LVQGLHVEAGADQYRPEPPNIAVSSANAPTMRGSSSASPSPAAVASATPAMSKASNKAMTSAGSGAGGGDIGRAALPINIRTANGPHRRQVITSRSSRVQ